MKCRPFCDIVFIWLCSAGDDDKIRKLGKADRFTSQIISSLSLIASQLLFHQIIFYIQMNNEINALWLETESRHHIKMKQLSQTQTISLCLIFVSDTQKGMLFSGSLTDGMFARNNSGATTLRQQQQQQHSTVIMITPGSVWYQTPTPAWSG